MIGLLSALEEEIALFKENAEISEEIVHAGITFYLGSLKKHKIVLARCGVGKVNAAFATQLIIDRFDINMILFSGLAGSLVPYLNRGDVVISNFVVQHDVDLTAFGRRHGQIQDSDRLIEAHPDLVKFAAEAYELVQQSDENNKSQAVVGTIATGDSFVSDPERIKWLQREFGAICTEMEGAAVGQVCRANNKPFVVIRVISDTSSGSAAGEFIMFLGEASETTFKTTSQLLENLEDEKLKTVTGIG
jgi:adenosylhomocysteine nucleosidase